MEGKVFIPSFVAANYNSLPHSNFEPLAAVLCSLQDEIATLRVEVAKLDNCMLTTHPLMLIELV